MQIKRYKFSYFKSLFYTGGVQNGAKIIEF